MIFAATLGMVDVVAGLGIAIALLAAGVLTIAETSFGRTTSTRLEALEEEPKASRVAELLQRPETILNPLRLVILILQLAEATVVTLLAARWLTTPGVVFVAMVNVAVLFVFTEAAPRTLGIVHDQRATLSLGGPVARLVGSPPVRLLANGLVAVANVVVPGVGLPRGPFASAEDLIALADVALDDEVIDEDERDLIESVIEFGDTVVREVMVPRTDMTTIERTSTVEDALQVTSEAGFSRVPMVGDNIDDVVGLAYVKDLIRAELDDKADVLAEQFLRPPHFVPETKRVSALLKEMQAESFHMAVAVDEYGGIAGLVTLEDLIEELVGEIVDEYDVEEPLVERQRDGSLRVDARILIDELNDLAGLDLPEGDWDTVGGLVLDRFGRVPSAGESCELDGYVLRAERVHGRRITRVLVLTQARAL